MQPAATARFTVAEYRAMPEGPPYYQLVEGELIMAPSPSSFHQDIAANIHLLPGLVIHAADVFRR